MDDTDREPGAPCPRLGAFLRAFATNPSMLARALDASAGAPDDPRRTTECRLVLANPVAWQAFVTYRQTLLARARDAFPAVNAGPAEAFVSALTERFIELEHRLWLRLVMTQVRDIGTPQAADPQVSLDAAIAYLRDTFPWKSAWDVHRFHPMGVPNVLVNRVFIQGMILLAWQHVDGSRQTDIEALLDQIPDDDLRYFPEWKGLPPDTDSLGLMLQLALHLPSPPHMRLEGWLSLLDHNLADDKLLPVWLDRGPQGPTATLPGPFLANACTATRVAVLLALVRYDAERFAHLLDPNLAFIMAQYGDDGFSGCVHYDTHFAVHLFLRLAAELEKKAVPVWQQTAHPLGIQRFTEKLQRKLMAEQRLDGGWGTPQRTAFALEGLAASAIAPHVLQRAVKYLVEMQGPDGSWAAEGFYITPRKMGGMTPFGSKEMTTALCARALHAAQVRLSEGF